MYHSTVGPIRLQNRLGQLIRFLFGILSLIAIQSAVFAQTAGSGGTVTTSGPYTVHTFTSSGTFTLNSPVSSIDVVIVGGGGGGGHQHAGGGGAGGVVSVNGLGIGVQSYTITVGAGGPGCTTWPYTGTNGGSSTAFGYTAAGGGAGTGMDQYGNDGASGGTDGYPSGGMRGGNGTAGQGNPGNRTYCGSPFNGGGGGGAGGAGSGSTGGLPLTTWAGTFGGGGGGGYAGGAGGGAGAGNGGYGAGVGGNASPNTGSGGGGGGNMDAFGGNGGSGIVVIRYINNVPPVLSSLTLTPSTITFGQTTTVSATITDADSNLYCLGILRYNGSTYFEIPGMDYSRTWGNGGLGGFDGGYYSSLSSTNDVASGGTTTKSLVFTPPTAGTFTFHANGHDGLAWTSNGGAYTNVTVNKATPTGSFSGRSFPGPHTLTSGDLNATFANPYNGAVSAPTGTISYNYPVGTVLQPGTYTVTATYPGDGNYNSTTVSATFTVNKITPTITWSTPAAITYGTALSATQLNATSSAPGTLAYSPASGAVLAAGTRTLNVTFTPTDTNTYNSASGSVSLVVNKAALTITANNASRTYGAANPTFTASYSGFVNGDTSAVVSGLALSTTATATSPAGSYPITPSGGTAANYNITNVNGTLTVTAGGQTVTLTTGSTSVAGGSTGTTSTPTGTLITFTASNGSSGVYTWTIDGVTQGNTGTTLTTSFSTAGTHTVSVIAAANGSYAASAAATFNVTVTAGNIWTVVTGQTHAVALKSDGTVWTWGGNSAGQLGDGTTTSRAGPAQVSGLTNVVAVAAGANHSAAVKLDGTVWTWGSNSSGQLGDGTVTNRLSPVQATGLSGIVDIMAGASHTLALKNDGTVWAWGGNASGQLGDGTTTQRNSAVQITALANVTILATGSDHGVALKADGSVWSWGKNDAGQTGDGTTTNRVSPAQVSGISGAIEASAGASHTLVLKTDGTVWSWGANVNGQIGDGTTTRRAAPTQVSGLTGVITIGAGSDHSIAVKSDGTVRTWGKNALGQIGDGTTTDRLSPVTVTGPTSIVAVAGNSAHSFAVKNDGTLYSWGGDGFGSATIANQRINQIALRLIGVAGDTDQDGMLDSLETQYFGNLSRSGSADLDGDGLSDVQELYLGSDPTKTDTDGDSITDLNDAYPVDYYNNAAPSIVVLGGNNQTTPAGQFNSAPFDMAIATNPGGQLLVNAPVTFTVVAGGGFLSTTNVGNATLSTLSLRTDSAGSVKAYYRQPFSAGVSSQIRLVAGLSQQLLNTTSSTAPNTPPVPGNLVSVATTSTSVSLFWTCSDSTNVAGYNIYRNGTLIATTSGTGTYYTDQNLTGSTTYSYTVQAFNSAGVLSAQTTAVGATTVATSTPSLEIFAPLK